MSISKKVLFDKGDRIQWEVSSPGYLSQSDQLTINEDTTLHINLIKPKIVFSWDGGGTKKVWFGSKSVTSTSPIRLGNDGPMTSIDYRAFYNDTTTKNIYIDAEGFPDIRQPFVFVFDYGKRIENVEIVNSSHFTDLGHTFSNLRYLKTVSIDTSGARILSYMFHNSAIENPPILNTSNVTDVSNMFSDCTKLNYIEQYDFSNVTNMEATFMDCSKITSVPYLDTHNVIDIQYCFANCTNLKSIPLLDFSNVTNTNNIFYECTSLTDVGGFTGLKADISFYYSPLTHTSALNVINNLPVSSGHKVVFKYATLSTLTAEEIAIATNKGWTIARS